MQTNELTGAALDWAVAQCYLTAHDAETNLLMVTVGDDNGWKFSPSTDWAQGGPIIEREKIKLSNAKGCGWFAYCGVHDAQGPTPLIAAMRCYVASKMGDEVDVPKELTC